MSKELIHKYYNDLQRAKQFGGSENETVIRNAFFALLNGLARKKNLELVPEISIKSTIGTIVRPDGVLRNALQLDCGFWESKDIKDDIDKEIQNKFKKGYPKGNIVFEDTKTLILIQEGREFGRCDMQNEDKLLQILNQFINFERPEVKEFNSALQIFKTDLPKILVSLRKMIQEETEINPDFLEKLKVFLKLCQKSINANLILISAQEMLIQHILTAEIFMSIFENADYHRDNNIANNLYEVERTFFLGENKQNLLASIRPYYKTIKSRANEMVSHDEKQKFLKVIYENFYKSYNPKGADKLGIVYTPNEIVKFMIEGTDFLLDRHFERTLGDRNVEILDPCTGTGTFITELIQHIPAHQLPYKYEQEIHANEMALLPYYVANLNIETVYQQKMKHYKEFKNLCFVDTLDNTASLAYAGKQNEMFGAISLENFKRIKEQNDKKISVIIGNPPYNAHQENYNLQNANRLYADIDKRIKETYIKEGTAQNQIVVYDMYVRFLRWASDRLEANGILSFVSNSSFIDSASFDGFRKLLAQDFQEIWIVDMKGNARTSGERRRQEKGNVFEDKIRVGVAISFFIKKEKASGCKIFYHAINDYLSAEAKRDYLSDFSIEKLVFERIRPDEKGNWINQTENDFETLIPLVSKDVKAGKSQEAVFQLFSNGIKTKRDEWVYDLNPKKLEKKVKFLLEIYKQSQKLENPMDDLRIKWSRLLYKLALQKTKIKYDKSLITKVLYRPFFQTYYYQSKQLTDDFHRMLQMIHSEQDNIFISLSGIAHQKPFHCLVSDKLADVGLVETAQNLPLFRYEKGKKVENITDWALALFREKYSLAMVEDLANAFSEKRLAGSSTTANEIEKQDIFHYVYAVLHNPKYRTKYAQNLKRDFPRIPLYENFWFWAEKGAKLMDLHLNYDKIEDRVLRREDRESRRESGVLRKENRENTTLDTLSSRHQLSPKLKVNKELGEIYIDEITTLTGIPQIAWEYKLGNRSALEWVLEQYKERKISDQSIAENFEPYKFADYKEEVIELLQKVCAVSVETMKIIAEIC
ncbi:MAG: DNA methyltransferase [Bacteroidetes bacterium]|nr:MAG: DNA methyltransferase [Bacteroidota bacterium]